VDAVIQGSAVRVVIHGGEPPLREGSLQVGFLHEDMKNLSRRIGSEAGENPPLSCRPTAPRFEDAFMDILGGARPGNPAVAKFFNLHEDLLHEDLLHEDLAKNAPGGVVEARGLTKRFGTFTAVDDVSFSIRRGEIFGLLGPNGAGKSTTFKMMCGLLTPTSGECAIAGIDFGKAPGEARSRLGYMAQRFSLYGELSVKWNLDFFAGVYGLKGEEKKDIVGRLIDAFDLSRYLRTPAGSLPLGFKQRLAMGCAIMHGPDVLFLDEPTSGVDPVTRREFWTYINSAALRGVAVMVTTHFMDEAEYCDRIALVYRGKVIASGTPDSLKSGAASPESQPAGSSLEEAFIELIEQADAQETPLVRLCSKVKNSPPDLR
jgi:ABC-2 type transport system ATP-binding protein